MVKMTEKPLMIKKCILVKNHPFQNWKKKCMSYNSYIAGGNANGTTTWGKSMAVSYKIKHTVTL